MEILQMKGITKRYPGTVALDQVDFRLEQGEFISLLGENGAGKTTLMKILYGLTKPDEGTIFFKGKETTLKNPTDAIDLGICMVHQHFMLVPAFSVTENIVVGAEPHKGVVFDAATARQKVKQLIERFRFNIDPDTLVSSLSVGEQQRVEILKALYREADIIILDEPTAVLTPSEVNELFVILQELHEQGKTIIIITHKLKETMAMATRVVVLRDGKVIASELRPSEVSVETLSETMVGRKVDLATRRPAQNIGEPCLAVSNLNFVANGKKRLDNIQISIRKGEIVGIAGIEGNGQSQLIEALTGCAKPDEMTLTLDGKPLLGTARNFLHQGVAHVPEDRLKQGLVREMSIESNMILGYHHEPDISHNGILKQRTIKEYTSRLKEQFLVKAPSISTLVSSLSGGNQQKVIIARAFSRDPKALIIAHPTRGVDIGAMEYIHQQMIDLRDAGKAILLISADLDEVRTLSDRILVLYEGEIVSESLPGELSEIELGLLMTGGNKASTPAQKEATHEGA